MFDDILPFIYVAATVVCYRVIDTDVQAKTWQYEFYVWRRRINLYGIPSIRQTKSTTSAFQTFPAVVIMAVMAGGDCFIVSVNCLIKDL